MTTTVTQLTERSSFNLDIMYFSCFPIYFRGKGFGFECTFTWFLLTFYSLIRTAHAELALSINFVACVLISLNFLHACTYFAE